MFIPANGYSLKIRAKPKVQTSTDFGRSSGRRQRKPKEEQERTPQQELIWNALRIVHEVKTCLKSYSELFHRLNQVVVKSLDLKFTDNDRRLMNKQYQAVLRQLDELITNTTVENILVLENKTKNPGIEIPISMNGEERMHVSLSGLDLDSLRLRETRIDSIVYARKVEKIVGAVAAKISSLEKYIESKFAALELKRENVGLAFPDFLLEGSERENYIDEVFGGDEEEPSEIQTPQLIELKERQQKAARAKGRQSALLVNTKV